MFSCRLTLPCGRAKVCRGLFLCPHAGFPRVPMQRDPRGCKMPLKCLLRASINCQAGLSSSRQEQMNQTLNGKIKPLKVLKTTQLQRAPLCRTGSPSEREREGFFKPNWDFSGGLPPPYLLAASLSEGEVLPRLPRSRMSGWQEKSHLFSIWILTSIHPAFLLPALPRSQPPELACAPGRPPRCFPPPPPSLFFFPLFFFFSSKNVCGLLCPPFPPAFSQAHAPAQPSPRRGLPRASLRSAPLRSLARRIPK